MHVVVIWRPGGSERRVRERWRDGCSERSKERCWSNNASAVCPLSRPAVFFTVFFFLFRAGGGRLRLLSSASCSDERLHNLSPLRRFFSSAQSVCRSLTSPLLNFTSTLHPYGCASSFSLTPRPSPPLPSPPRAGGKTLHVPALWMPPGKRAAPLPLFFFLSFSPSTAAHFVHLAASL